MRLLLDTHIALWAILDDPRLATSARDLIIDATNDVQISAASVWEIAIKHALGRGRADAMPVSCREALGYFRQSGYRLLPITAPRAQNISPPTSLNLYSASTDAPPNASPIASHASSKSPSRRRP